MKTKDVYRLVAYIIENSINCPIDPYAPMLDCEGWKSEKCIECIINNPNYIYLRSENQ